MRKPIVLALLFCLLLCGCSFNLTEEKTPEQKAGELISAGASAENPEAALESYRAAEKLTPENTDILRAQIAVLQQLAAQGGDYPEQLIAAYESLYYTDAFTEEDYLALARLYLDAGENRQARDLLEKGQCLSPTSAKAELLDTVCVDINTEEAGLKDALNPLLESLASGDRDGAADCLMSEGLYEKLESRVFGGSRRYLGKAGGGTVKLEAAPDGSGADRLRLWYFDGGRVTLMRVSTGELFIAEAAVKDNSYEGDFSTEVYTASDGSVLMDSGTVSGGIVTGAVTTELYTGTEATELPNLWAGRAELERTVYTGELDEEGHALAEQASGLEEGQIVYAYTEGDNSYIYMIADQEDTAEGFVFTAESFGLEPLPQW